MEELKCYLLGFGSCDLPLDVQDPLTTDEGRRRHRRGRDRHRVNTSAAATHDNEEAAERESAVGSSTGPSPTRKATTSRRPGKTTGRANLRGGWKDDDYNDDDEGGRHSDSSSYSSSDISVSSSSSTTSDTEEYERVPGGAPSTNNPPPLSAFSPALAAAGTLHPAEAQLLSLVLPLGRQCAAIRAYERRARTSALGELYPPAVAIAAGQIVAGDYQEAVRACHTPAAVAALHPTFALTFELLTDLLRLGYGNRSRHRVGGRNTSRGDGGNESGSGSRADVGSARDAGDAAVAASEALLAGIHRFLQHQEVPARFRRLLGESVCLAVLFTTAHYIAHGVVLHGHRDFFIATASAGSADRHARETDSHTPVKGAAAAAGGGGTTITTRSPAARGSRTRQRDNNSNSTSDIATAPSTTATAASGSGSSDGSSDYVLREGLLPLGITTELGLRILAAGKARRALLTESASPAGRDGADAWPGPAGDDGNGHHCQPHKPRRRHGGDRDTSQLQQQPQQQEWDYVDQLAAGAADEAAEAVFSSIFSPALCRDNVGGVGAVGVGALAVDELASRTDAALSLWSRALWSRVGRAPALLRAAAALRCMFLCHRGDVWLAFSEELLQPLMAAAAAGSLGAAPTTATAPPALARVPPAMRRAVQEAFTAALGVGGLSDDPLFGSFMIDVASLDDADILPHSRRRGVGGVGASSSSSSPPAPPAALQGPLGAAHMALRFLSQLRLSAGARAVPRLMVSAKALQYYQRVFSLQLAVRAGLHALHRARAPLAQAVVATAAAAGDARGNEEDEEGGDGYRRQRRLPPSRELRRALALHQRLLFIATTLLTYLQLDAVAGPAATFAAALGSPRGSGGGGGCQSVEEAKRAHDRFIWAVADACFVTEGREGVAVAAGHALPAACLALYALCTGGGADTPSSTAAAAPGFFPLHYWAVDGANAVPPAVAAALAALESAVARDVVAVLAAAAHTPAMRAAPHAALWSRLDFNGFFSATAHTASSNGSGSGGGAGGGHRSTHSS